ncbi:hypothetical protein [Maridesulfovibrio bastinii]|uniref:hypothetical protein n=1 Tax=Maridesulfovibrio bastinii TaxID=47157 RepID=UPI00040E04B5|nr:hypothetical protein [Maridesulfovibrio bastinii]
MRSSKFILSAIIILTLIIPSTSFAQVCSNAFVSAASSISAVSNFSGEKGLFLAVLDSNKKTDAVKCKTAIKKIMQKKSGTCDFSDYRVVIIYQNFNRAGEGFPKPVKDSDFEKLLYAYVYSLNPADVQSNLKGYRALLKLNPSSSYYKARLAHYEGRKELHQARKEFISKAMKMAVVDNTIIDIRMNREFCFIVTASGDPMKTAAAFINKVKAEVPDMSKDPCIFVYDSDLKKAGEACPQWTDSEKADQEEMILLLSYVKSLPGFELEKNMNGYKALSKMQPNSSFFKNKIKFYSKKLHDLESFSQIKSAAGNPVFIKHARKGAIYTVEIDDNAVKGLDGKALEAFYNSISSFYEFNGAALNRCLVSAHGQVAGTITCNKKGHCTFTKQR